MGNSNGSSSVALNGRRNLARFLWDELKPRGKFLTVFNVISIPVILLAAVLVFIRFSYGLASVTNLSQEFPWGIWIGFDVITGVAFAGGAYVLTFMVYILGLKKYRPIVRATVLNGLLAYMFYAGCLLLDVGRPWNVFNPFIGNAFGVSSIMFLIAWHFTLYIFACIVEFSPAVAEWLGLERAKKILSSLTLGAVIIGITLSTLHQSGLGALYVMAKGKLHPLWYTEFLPVLFFVSSIFAGLSMVIFECTISHKVFANQMGRTHKSSYDSIILGLSKICAVTMFVYLFMVLLVLVHNNNMPYLETPMGVWYLTEVLGFVVVPLILFVQGYRNESKPLVRIASVLTMFGIILNRLNVSVIAFKWYEPVRYFPSWMEIEITLAVIFIEIWIFRWIVRRMAILDDLPAWAKESKELAK
jgi:Ni/Fe-hydrogenase subunit HybB-like protein